MAPGAARLLPIYPLPLRDAGYDIADYADSTLLPPDPAGWRAFRSAALIERAIHELTVRIDEQRGWLAMPLRDLLDIART